MTSAAHHPDLPAPLVSAEVDLRGFSGFMLDVDRLLTSELVALGTPEECWAAFMLWCRAWKQSPPSSLPDDDRVLAAFSGAGKRWSKLKSMALRGFVRCSDGRLYHPVLAAEAAKGWKRRQQYEADQDRLRKWREGKKGASRNEFETPNETRFKTQSEMGSETIEETVREPERQGQGQYNTSLRSVSSVLTDGSDAPPTDPDPPPKIVPKPVPKTDRSRAAATDVEATDAEIERVLFAKGKQTLGPRSGGQISQLVRVTNGSHAQALAIIELAAQKQNPREYVAACIQRGGGRGPPSALPYDPGL